MPSLLTEDDQIAEYGKMDDFLNPENHPATDGVVVYHPCLVRTVTIASCVYRAQEAEFVDVA